MWGRNQRRKRTCGNVWKESAESKSGAGIPDTDLEVEEKDEEEEKDLKEHKVIEVSVNARKGERKQYYDAMMKLQEDVADGITFYINDRVATIVITEDKVDNALAVLEEAGLSDFGVYDRAFNPNNMG